MNATITPEKLIEVECCAGCFATVQYLGEDGVSFCSEGCGCVEGLGGTIMLTEQEMEEQ